MQPAVYALTAVAAVVVVLTRVRLDGQAAAGRSTIARVPVGVHTVAGALALLTWVPFLLLGDTISETAASLLGIAALLLWWVVVIAGLMLLVRWLPTRGRHAAAMSATTWARGPGISLLGHLLMLGAAGVFTYAYLFSKV